MAELSLIAFTALALWGAAHLIWRLSGVTRRLPNVFAEWAVFFAVGFPIGWVALTFAFAAVRVLMGDA